MLRTLRTCCSCSMRHQRPASSCRQLALPLFTRAGADLRAGGGGKEGEREEREGGEGEGSREEGEGREGRWRIVRESDRQAERERKKERERKREREEGSQGGMGGTGAVGHAARLLGAGSAEGRWERGSGDRRRGLHPWRGGRRATEGGEGAVRRQGCRACCPACPGLYRTPFLSLSHTHPHSHSLTLTLSHSLSLSNTHTHTHTPAAFASLLRIQLCTPSHQKRPAVGRVFVSRVMCVQRL
jgi:hypothetical protein